MSNDGVAQPRFRRGDECGRYVIVDRIGSGAMGVVYSAFDPHLGRQIALKVVRPAALQQVGAGTVRMRLLREAQAMARLSHPNVVSVYDAGADDRQVFLAMELVSGRNLRQHLARTAMVVNDALDIMVQAGRGLVAAHGRGIVHRDFKPENVLVADDSRVCVTDFGLARPCAALDRATDSRNDPSQSGVLGVTLTLEGDTVGTPAYMAPEQLAGRPADPRADQYAYCTTLFEVLFGRRPFAGKNAAALRSVKAKGAPAIPAQAQPRRVVGGTRGATGPIPTWLRELLHRGLQPEPQRRFESMDALLEELERHRPRRGRSAKLLPAALAVGAVVLATLGVAYHAQADQPCAGAGEPPSDIWSMSSRTSIRSAFEDGGQPFAADVAQRAITVIDGHVVRWNEAHREVCEATWLHGEQSPRLLDARMGCLQGQWSQLEATVELLQDADDDVIDHAMRLVEGLPDASRCQSLRIESGDGPPTQPELRARWDALRAGLARADAKHRAGKTRDALGHLEDIMQDVRDLEHPALLVRTLLMFGRLHHDLGALDAAELALREALTTATGAKLTTQEAEAWILLGQLAVDADADYERTRFCTRMALSVVDDAGGDTRLESWAHTNLGTAAFLAEDDETALHHWQRALQLRRELLGDEHTLVAASLNNLGGALYGMGRLDEAGRHLRQARQLRIDLLGEDHPDVAESAVNLGLVLLAQGHPNAALDLMRGAVRILQRASGVDHPRLARAEDGLGQALLEVGRPTEALEHFFRAKRLYGQVHRPDHPAMQHANQMVDAARAAIDAP